MASNVHISINAETLFEVAGVPVTNSMVTSAIVSVLIIAFAVWVSTQIRKTGKPTGVQNLAEWIIESLLNLVNSVTGDSNKSRRFFPWIATFFVFILINNWFGLLPGVGTIGFEHTEPPEVHETTTKLTEEIVEVPAHSETDTGETETIAEATLAATAQESDGEYGKAEGHSSFVPFFRPGTADINMTIALALISVSLTQVYGLRFTGLSYLKKYFNFSSPIMFYVGILELVSEFAKIISFAFRLFGNIFAGEVLLVVISALTLVLIPVPFYGLEVFVGFIQALVFAMLTLVFFKAATDHH